MKELTPRMIQNCLRDVFTEAREKMGLTKKAMAERLSEGPPFINKIERGPRSIMACELPELAAAYGMSLVELLKRWERRMKRAVEEFRKGGNAT